MTKLTPEIILEGTRLTHRTDVPARGPGGPDQHDDLIDGMAEPAGAATAIELMTAADASLFI